MRTTHRGARLAGAALLSASTLLAARTWTVDDDGPADFRSIQQAIDAAAAGDVVEVAAGIYLENLVIKSGIVVRGAGHDLTTIDGGRRAPTAVLTDCDATTRLEGFRITGGQSDHGGGVLVQGGAPVISRNAITANSALSSTGYGFGYGGGMALVGSQAEVSENSVQTNDADFGGGVEIAGGSPRLTRNLITGNTAEVGGGLDAYLLGGDTPRIEGNRILANAASFGGGIELAGFGVPVVSSNLIVGNSASGPGAGYGGGVDVYYGDVRLLNNTLADNRADIGGGLSLLSDDLALLANNIVSGNQARVSGGADLSAPVARVQSNIFFSNSRGHCGGFTASLCDDPSNLYADPLFADPGPGDYRVLPGSPAIDSGMALPVPAADLRGQRRPLDGDRDLTAAFDRGAFEYDRDDVLGLGFSGPATLTWQPQSGASSYHVYSGSLATLRSSGIDACRDLDDPDRTDLLFTETLSPPPGEGYAYLVTAVVGGAERSPGYDGQGIERSLPSPCP